MWSRVADRLDLRIVIYPPKEPGTKAEIRVIGEFNPDALVTQPGLLVGTATVNTLSHGMNRKGVPEFVRANMVRLATLGIHYLR